MDLDEKKITITDNEMDSDAIERTFNEALQCCAEIEVGEVSDLMLGFWSALPQMGFFKDYDQKLSNEQKKDFDKFMYDLIVSIITTFLDNYQKREKPYGKA